MSYKQLTTAEWDAKRAKAKAKAKKAREAEAVKAAEAQVKALQAKIASGGVEPQVGGASVEETEEVDYADMTKKELKAEIEARNEGREEADLIVPESDKNADLISALEADDTEEEAS